MHIPGHRGGEALLKAVAGLPAQLVGDAGGVDGVAPVVAGPIRHGRDQLAVGPAGGQQLVEGGADRLHHLLVGAFPMAAHAVVAPQLSPAGGQQQGSTWSSTYSQSRTLRPSP